MNLHFYENKNKCIHLWKKIKYEVSNVSLGQNINKTWNFKFDISIQPKVEYVSNKIDLTLY